MSTVPEETWKHVPGFDGVEASSFGNIRRDSLLRRLSLTGKGYKIGHGYLAVRINGKLTKAHRLVATAFHPNPLGLPQVNHKDGCTTNNRPENLEWCDGSHNIRHAIKNGLLVSVRGEEVGTALLNADKAKEIFEAARFSSESYASIGQRFGISDTHVMRIANRLSWKHATPESGTFKRIALTPRGERSHKAKLTDATAKMVFESVRVHGVSQKETAERFGISTTAVWGVVYGHTWKHLNLLA